MQGQLKSLTIPSKVRAWLAGDIGGLVSAEKREHSGEATADEIIQFVLTSTAEKIFFPFSNGWFPPHSSSILSHTLVFLLWVKNQSPNGHHFTHIAKGCSAFSFLQPQVHAKLHRKKAKWGFLGHYTVSRLRNVSIILMKFSSGLIRTRNMFYFLPRANTCKNTA